jgi:hypothetical protein
VVRTTTGFHTNLAARLNALPQHLQPVLPCELPPPHRFLAAVYAMDLEDVIAVGMLITEGEPNPFA